MTFTLDRIVDAFRIGQRLVIESNGEYDILRVFGINEDSYSCHITYAYHPIQMPNGKSLEPDDISAVPVTITKDATSLFIGNFKFEIKVVVDDLPNHLDSMQAIRHAVDVVSKTC